MNAPLRFLLLLFTFCIGHCEIAVAQISFDQAVRGALEKHVQLRVAKSNVAIAQARLIDAGKLENPIFEFALRSQAKDEPERQGSIFVGYSQAFPVTDRLLRERDLGVAGLHLACAEVRDVERKFIAEVQQTYISAAGFRVLADELTLLETNADRSLELAKKQLANAQGSELEVASATTEKLLATQARLSAEADYEVGLAKLRPYLQMAPHERLQLSQGLDRIIEILRPTVQKSVPAELKRSDISAAEAKVEMNETNLKLARAGAIEDWTLAAGYESMRTVDEPVGADRDRFFGLGVKIPLPMRKKGAGPIAEAGAENEKSQLELERTRLAANAEVAVQIAALKAAEQNLSSLGDQILPQLIEREKKTFQGYEQGLLDFTQVILLQQQQARIREAIARAKLSKALALAGLQEALGSNPLLDTYDQPISSTH